ncbi:MAG: exo-alpha-sialidase [Nitrospirae bacterium]|nr:exo-alpha-sialidase [Nitrospirota bacterium]
MQKGVPAYSWYDQQKRLMLATGEKSLWVSEGAPAPSRLSLNQLYADGPALYSLFRPKIEKGGKDEDIGMKYMIFRASYDGGKTLEKPVILNREGNAMQGTLAFNGKGDVYAVWSDERSGPLDIYMNISRDYGKTWLPSEMRVDTEDAPGSTGSSNQQVFASGDRVWVIWVDQLPDESDDLPKETDDLHKAKAKKERNKNRKMVPNTRLMVRSSADAGKTWTEPKSIHERDNYYAPQIFLAGNRLLIIWCGTATGKFQSTARGIYSNDQGSTWQPAGEMPLNSWMQFELPRAVDSKGNIFLTLSIREKFKKGIDNVYFLASYDKGQTWTEPVRIQSNAPHHTYAGLPQIVIDSHDRIAVSWVDYRNIRGAVYFNASKDAGKTWLPQEMLLSRKSRNSNYPTLAAGQDGKFQVVWLEYEDDNMKAGTIRSREVQIP